MALFFLSQYFLPLEDLEGKLDRLKIHELILFHDFGEILNGDIPYHWKTDEDEKNERNDAEKVFDMLPSNVGRTGYEAWKEYEEQVTPESRFVNAVDKLEPAFELLDPINGKTFKRLKFTYDMHLEKKRIASKGFPVIWKFVEVLSKHMLEKDLFWKEGNE